MSITSILLTIFVLPELHGNGIGRYIIQTLEQDELFLRADRIEIPASITAVEFYKKQGYDYKNGISELDDEGHYRLEKFNVNRLETIAADGIAPNMADYINNLNEEEFELYVKYHLKNCNRQDLIGYSNHILEIVEKN